MNILKLRSSLSLAGLAALFLLGGIAAVSARGEDAPTLQRLATEKAPLKSHFEKKATTDGAPYTLTLTNTSSKSVKVTIKVLLSVAFHADNRARNIPEQSIEAGNS